MKIVNENVDGFTIDPRRIHIKILYPEYIQDNIDSITKQIKTKAYNYGSSQKAKEAIDESVKDYLKSQKFTYNAYILVDDIVYAIYDDEKEARQEFINIIHFTGDVYYLKGNNEISSAVDEIAFHSRIKVDNSKVCNMQKDPRDKMCQECMHFNMISACIYNLEEMEEPK